LSSQTLSAEAFVTKRDKHASSASKKPVTKKKLQAVQKESAARLYKAATQDILPRFRPVFIVPGKEVAVV
jgi:hypothetical protein